MELMPAPSRSSELKIARLFLGGDSEAEWENVLASWFQDACANSWRSRLPYAVLTPSRTASHFLRRRLLEKTMNFAGIHFWTPPECRAFLMRALRLPRLIAIGENLRLLLAAAAERDQSRAASSVALNPANLLRELDQLGAAGWNFREARLNPLQKIVADFEELVAASGCLFMHEADRELFRRAANAESRLAAIVILGFGAAHWPLLNFLQAAATASQRAEILLLAPRGPAAVIEMRWVGTWEESFGEAVPLSPAERKRPFAIYAEAIESGVAPVASQKIQFLLGANTREQAQAILAQIVAWLAEPDCERLGVLFPGYSALSREVSLMLDRFDLLYNDGLTHLRPGPFETEEWQAWLDVQSNPRGGSLIRFLRVCPSDVLADFSREKIEETIHRAFAETLVNDLTVISEFLLADETDSAVGEWIRNFSILPETGTFEELIAATRKIFSAYEWKDRVAALEPHIEPLSRALKEPISRRVYLAWLVEIIHSFERVRSDTGGHPYSRVHLIPYDNAAGANWTHLILTGLNEGVWPPLDREGGFVSEADLERLNGLNRRALARGRQGEGHVTTRPGRGLLVGPVEKRALARAHFYGLLETVEVKLCATSSLIDECDPERHLKPSEFLNRLYFLDRGEPISDAISEALAEKTRAWIKSAAILPSKAAPDPTTLAAARQTRTAFDARRDPTETFGRYEFAFRAGRHANLRLSCKSWEDALRSPTFVWMDYFLKIRAREDGHETPFSRTLGIWAHGWLSRIIDKPGAVVATAMPTGRQIVERVRAAAAGTRSQIEQLAAKSGRRLPPWWISVWSQALYMADSLGRSVAELTGWQNCFTELKLPERAVSLSDRAQLFLRGRIDLLLQQPAMPFAEATELIIDYKTGAAKNFKLENLYKGDGVQLALYALARAQDFEGAIEAAILRPAEPFEGPHLALEGVRSFDALWQELARMQDSGNFGIKGEIHPEFGFQNAYPLATLAIDPEVLAEKWTLSHPGFQAVEEVE
jgi:hypothetical protein